MMCFRGWQQWNAVAVFHSLTTLDGELRKVMEPRTSPPAARLAASGNSRSRDPVGVLHAPIIPGLTDHEIPSLVAAAADAGAKYAGYVVLRLPYAVAPMFEQWLCTAFSGEEGKGVESNTGDTRRQTQFRPSSASGCVEMGFSRQIDALSK